MNKKIIQGILLTSCSLLFAIFLGCTMTHTITAKPSLKSLPQKEKLPLKAGVYYSPEFSAYKHTRTTSSNWVFPIGTISKDLFYEIFPLVFEDVRRVYNLPPYSSNTYDVDFVIEPLIEHFHFHLGMEPFSELHCIVYRFILYTMDGTPVSTWKIIGKGAHSHWDAPAWAHVNRDLDDAAEKFIETISASSGIDKIFVKGTNRLLSAGIPCALNKEDITVSAEPYPVTFRMKDNKTVSFTDYGIIPIKVSIANSGAVPFTLNESSVRLYLNNQTSIPSTAMSAIFQQFEKRDYGGDVTSVFLGPIAGVAVSMAEESEDSKKRALLKKYLDDMQLKPTTLKKKQSVEGVLFFIPDEKSPRSNNAEVSVWLLDKNSKGLNIKTPINNLGYKNIKGGTADSIDKSRVMAAKRDLQHADEQAAANTIETMILSYNKNDIENHVSCYAPDARIESKIAGGFVSRDEYRQALLKRVVKKGKLPKIRLRDIKITIVSSDKCRVDAKLSVPRRTSRTFPVYYDLVPVEGRWLVIKQRFK